MKIEHLQEPELIFADGRRHIDPKLGLMLHGPSSWKHEPNRTGEMIKAAAIGTSGTLHQFREFLERMRVRIAPSERVPWKRDFPGLGVASALHFDINVDRDAEEVISREEEESVLAQEDRKKRILGACDLYREKFEDLMSTVHPKPHIVYVLVSRALMDATKDPHYKIDHIVLTRRSMEKEVKWDEGSIFDFHHFLKVVGFRYDVASQMVRPSTLEGENGQDRATTAWNFAVASYYKATGTPWKLADLDEGTCYVGISFYQEPGEETNMRASMAHLYLRSGESQVIRGKPFRWDKSESRSPHLTAEQASEILLDVVSLYKKQQGRAPTRVVVHKTSSYSEDEIEGFTSEAGNGYLDLVYLQRQAGVRLYIEGNQYPPLRGTLLSNGEMQPAVLYTTGFIPALGTYPGSTVPEPVAISWARKDSAVSLLARDVLALTKLDWNNSDFCTALPVTISVSRKVGEILAESRAKNVTPPSIYRYYM